MTFMPRFITSLVTLISEFCLKGVVAAEAFAPHNLIDLFQQVVCYQPKHKFVTIDNPSIIYHFHLILVNISFPKQANSFMTEIHFEITLGCVLRTLST